MWDPFRYKLGGKLLNGSFVEFVDRYGAVDSGKYTATRDIAAYAILKEVEAGRGTPHGGAYLDFRHIPEAQLRAAFGPVIDRLLANGIDLTKTPVEVGPTAHYHMGGIRVNARMETCIQGLYAAGEAVGGANGANRLSGNAITEAFVFGARAGACAGKHAKTMQENGDESGDLKLMAVALGRIASMPLRGAKQVTAPVALQAELQKLMWEKAGPFRTGKKLSEALRRIREMREQELPALEIATESAFNMDLQDWFELRAMLMTAEAVVTSALARTESRGAHQREDYPNSDPLYLRNQVLKLKNGALLSGWVDPVRLCGRLPTNG
jgi:succinate dehydrogenase/fumarate reductase flavoprotein subunit